MKCYKNSTIIYVADDSVLKFYREFLSLEVQGLNCDMNYDFDIMNFELGRFEKLLSFDIQYM